MKHIIRLLLCIVTVWFVIEQLTYHPVCNGIDVSHHNNMLPWDNNPVIDSSIFIIAKATEGSSFVDPKFNMHRNLAKAKNVMFGAYHFLTKEKTPKDQFEHFKKVVGNDIDLIPCLDVEKYANKHWGYSQLRKYVREWSALCKAYYGKYPIIYCTDVYRIVFFYDMPNQFWINNWHLKPLTTCAIHQYSNNDETLDYNHLNTDIKNLMLN